MRNRITSFVMSAMVLLPLLQSSSAYAENKADRGTITVTIIDEETNELFAEDRDCFEINSSIHLDSWNPSKSNPHTVTDVQTSFEYAVQYVGKDYDGYTYYIDTEKCDPLICFTDDTVKELTVYMKKIIWSNNNTPKDPADTELPEKKSFEELYDLDENELKQYCTAHRLNFISKGEAEWQISNKCGINIMVKPNNYLLSAKFDLLESEDLSVLDKNNLSDYDFEKMTADLNLPENYFKFNSKKNDFAFYATYKPDADGKPKQTFLKLAQIYVAPDNSAENERSLARLYQLACICAEQNPIVQCVSTEKIGYSNVDANKKIKGDVNNDGEFNISDVVILQKWLLAVPNTKLVNWKAADLCEDESLDMFDLCLMKKLLTEKNNNAH